MAEGCVGGCAGRVACFLCHRDKGAQPSQNVLTFERKIVHPAFRCNLGLQDEKYVADNGYTEEKFASQNGKLPTSTLC
jgi:hypothetical protein